MRNICARPQVISMREIIIRHAFGKSLKALSEA